MTIQLRPLQKTALVQIQKAIATGKTDILIQAPTGVGKSLIALELGKVLNQEAYILTSEKLLQQQYEEDCSGKFAPRHSDVASVSGIDNYNCHVNGKKFSLGHCKSMGLSNTKALDLPCASTCEYLQRWSRAKTAPVTLFNYSYYLIQMNYVLKNMGEAAPFQKRPVVICDEAHSLPNVIESHFACYVDRDIVERLRETQDALRTDGVILEFLGAGWGRLGKAISHLMTLKFSDINGHFNALTDIYGLALDIVQRVKDSKRTIRFKYGLTVSEEDGGTDFIQAAQTANERMPQSVKNFLIYSDEFKDYYCKLEDYLTIIREQGLDNMAVEAKPNGRVYRNLCDEKLFDNHFKPFSDVRIYLSATLQPDNLIKRWNLQPQTTEVIVLNSGWDPKNSPVYLRDVANFKHANIQQVLPSAVSEIDDILQKHQGERGIIHTTSYEILKTIQNESRYAHRLVVYANSAEKGQVLKSLQSLPEDSVLIGPSLTQGVDLPDDLARFNIIVKMSYPNISSGLWRKRFQKRRYIYWAEAANVLEQSAGRSTRHSEDQSSTYILDSRASKFTKSPSTRKYFSTEFLSRLIAA